MTSRDVRQSNPSPKPVLIVRFKKFFFCWKGMTSETHLLFFCLTIHPSIRTDEQTKSAFFYIFRSNSLIFKILFFCLKVWPRYLHCKLGEHIQNACRTLSWKLWSDSVPEAFRCWDCFLKVFQNRCERAKCSKCVPLRDLLKFNFGTHSEHFWNTH